MRQRLQIFVILFAWLMATSTQWDLVQTFGWTRMIVNYSKTMPLLEAIQHTFDGEMCGVCRVVNDARQQENETTFPNRKLETKMIFVLQPVPDFIAPARVTAAWSPGEMPLLSASRAAPPTPPPRV